MLLNQHWRILISRSTSKVFRSVNLQIKSVKRAEHFLSSQIEGLNVYYYSKHRELRSERLFRENWTHGLTRQLIPSNSLLPNGRIPCLAPSPMPSLTVFLAFTDLLMSQFPAGSVRWFSFIIFFWTQDQRNKSSESSLLEWEESHSLYITMKD